MGYLLDTNAWINLFASPNRLSESSRKVIANEDTLYLATISLIEVCQKVATGQLEFDIPIQKWIELATPPETIQLLPIDAKIAQEAYEKAIINPANGKPHKDPADLIIAATGNLSRHTIVTSDKILLSCPGLKTLSTRN